MKGKNKLHLLSHFCIILPIISVTLERMIVEMQRRIDKLSGNSNMGIVSDWIAKYLSLAKAHLLKLDSIQGTILKEEIVKLQADYKTTKELDSLIEELILRYNTFSCWNEYES